MSEMKTSAALTGMIVPSSIYSTYIKIIMKPFHDHDHKYKYKHTDLILLCEIQVAC